MCSLFRLQWASFLSFAGLAPAPRPGTSVCPLHALASPCTVFLLLAKHFCLFSVSSCVIIGVRLKSLVPGGQTT